MGSGVVSHGEADTERGTGSHIYELGRRKHHKAKEDIIVTGEATGHW